MKIDIGDKIKFQDEEQQYDVLFFDEKFVICLNSSRICSVIDLKHDGNFNINECQKVLESLGIKNKINFNDSNKVKIEKVTKMPKFDFIDYPSEAFEYKGYYGHDITLSSNAYYSYL